MIKTVNKHLARSLCLLFLFGLLFARFSTARAAPEPQLTVEDTCIVLLLNEAGNGMNLGKPPGSTYTANTGLAVGSIPVPNGLMAIDIYYGLPAYYRMEFDYYCPGSGDRDCEGTLRNDSTLSTDDHFVKVGDWKFVVIERFSSSTGTFINADAHDEGQVLFQTAKKYWNIYQQNGRCDGSASEPSGPIISEPQYSNPNGEYPEIDEPQYSDPNGELPLINEPQSADPSSSDACQNIACFNPACSEDGTQAWFNPVCVNGFCDYSSSPAQACEHGCEDGVGCLDDRFNQWCAELISSNCQPYCENGWLYTARSCTEDGSCIYRGDYCANGCANAHCLSKPSSGGSDLDGLLGLLAVGGGIAVLGGGVLGGGYLGYRLLQSRKLARGLMPKTPKPAGGESLLDSFAEESRNVKQGIHRTEDALNRAEQMLNGYYKAVAQEHLASTESFNSKLADALENRAVNLEKAAKYTGWVKKGADTTMDIIGYVPKAGSYSKLTYKGLSKWGESYAKSEGAFSKEKLWNSFKDGAVEVAENFIGDKVGGALGIIKTNDLPLSATYEYLKKTTVKTFVKDVGVKEGFGEWVKDQFVNKGMGQGKKLFGIGVKP